MTPSQAEEFAILWASAQSTLASFVRTLVPDIHQAEEVLQRVAVALVRKFDEFDKNRSFAAWAVGVAKYEVLYFRRERATDKHLFDDEIVDRVALSYQRFVEDADPFREALEGCLKKLKGRARRVIEMRYEQGLASAAIAEKLRLTTGAVRMLLCRVRQTLRTCIDRRLQAVKD